MVSENAAISSHHHTHCCSWSLNLQEWATPHSYGNHNDRSQFFVWFSLFFRVGFPLFHTSRYVTVLLPDLRFSLVYYWVICQFCSGWHCKYGEVLNTYEDIHFIVSIEFSILTKTYLKLTLSELSGANHSAGIQGELLAISRYPNGCY